MNRFFTIFFTLVLCLSFLPHVQAQSTSCIADDSLRSIHDEEAYTANKETCYEKLRADWRENIRRISPVQKPNFRFTSARVVYGLLEQDSLTLVDLYETTGGPGWRLGGGWFIGPADNWPGVVVRDGRVVELWLPRNNMVGAIPPSIGQLDSLELINFGRSRLTSIPPEIGRLKKLRYLSLNANQLTSIPDEIGQATGLSFFDLSNNRITELPVTIGQLTNLSSLVLFFNRLTTIPASIGNLINLRGIDLEGNRLTLLPSTIGKLDLADQVSFRSNQLTTIPTEMGLMDTMSILVLDDNQITSLPPGLFMAPRLSSLHVRNNQITSIPVEISQAPRLRDLDLSQNEITSIPPQLGQSTSMTSLRLSGNRLTSLPPELSQMQQLGELYVADNQLKSIPVQFNQLDNLEKLDLSGNQFLSIPEFLGQMEKLSWLYLSRNRLNNLPQFLKDDFYRLWVDSNFLTFEDLLVISPNFYQAYAPQARVGSAHTKHLKPGEFLTLSYPVGGERYFWYRNEELLAETESDSLVIGPVTIEDAGTYVVRIHNYQFRDLELESHPVTLVVGEESLVCGPIVTEKDESGTLLAVRTYARDAVNGIREITFTRLNNVRGYLDSGSGWQGPYRKNDSVLFEAADSVAIRGERIDLAAHGAIMVHVTSGNGQTKECDPVLDRVEAETPHQFALEQNYPNPFNPETTIRFQVAERARVTLGIFDVLGREVVRLVEREMEPGSYQAVWDGRNSGGVAVAGGLYFYRMQAGEFTLTQTMSLVK